MRVVEKPLSRAIRSRLAPMVWLLINRGSRPESIHVSCLRKDFPQKCTEIEELRASLIKFLLQDRKCSQIVLDANDVHREVEKRNARAAEKAWKKEEREKAELLWRIRKKKEAAKREKEAVIKWAKKEKVRMSRGLGYSGSQGRLDVTPESSWADDDSTIEEEGDTNIVSVETKVAILNARNMAMKKALRGEWCRSFECYASDETVKFIDVIRKSSLPERAQNIVISTTLTMHPFSSNIF